MAKYVVTDTALRSIADAIRTKTDSLENLSFPNGFIEKINNIETVDPIELASLNITENGEYEAQNNQAFNNIIVEVPDNIDFIKGLIDKTATDGFIPENITKIGSFIFMGCTNLQYLEIPNTVTEIGESAFRDCENLNIPNIPDSIEKIGARAFSNCHNLQAETLPSKLTIICDSTFNDCKNVKFTKLPDNLVTIERCAFWECDKYFNISSIPATVQTIADRAFYKCNCLTNIEFLGTPDSIHENTFYKCDNLKDIYVPWAEGEVTNAPWGAPSTTTIHYNWSNE